MQELLMIKIPDKNDCFFIYELLMIKIPDKNGMSTKLIILEWKKCLLNCTILKFKWLF